MGPTSVCDASGLPTIKARVLATNASVKRSAMPRCTRMRDPAIQIWPLLLKILTREPSTARSISASSKTMLADLPPSSKWTGVRFAAAAAITCLAVLPPPVNPMRSISGEPASAAPVTAPLPFTTLIVPGGRPASSINATNFKMESGVNSEGFSTQVLPNARLEAICMLARASGAFHGANNAATPAGCRVTLV